nr:hypothetical protein [Sediminimonas sp.]
MQKAHQLGRLDVDRILIAELAALDAKDETEALNMLGQVLQGKGGGLAAIEIGQFEGLEIADQNVTGLFVIGDVGQVFQRLLLGLEQITPFRFLLDNQGARPEQIDKAPRPPGALHRKLVLGHAPPFDSEDVKEGVVKALRLALFIVGVFPVIREAGGAGANFVPGQPHGPSMAQRGGFG